jgi:hypothetical protein
MAQNNKIQASADEMLGAGCAADALAIAACD